MLDDPNGSLAQAGSPSKTSTPVLDRASLRGRAAGLRLAVMPAVLARLVDACQAEEAPAEELAAIIALDPALTARVFALASAGDDAEMPAGLARCVALVGNGVIRSMAGAEAAARVFGATGREHDFILGRTWFHALKTAALARTLAAGLGYAEPDEAYLAGLLHDVGMLALAAIDPAGYPWLLHHGRDDEALCRTETERYGASHAEVGAWMAEAWQRQSFLPDAILYHHVPAERAASAHPLIRIVLLANQLAQLECAPGDTGAAELARLCGVGAEIVAPAMDLATLEFKRVCEMLAVAPPAASAPLPVAAPPTAPGWGAPLTARLQDKLLFDGLAELLREGRDTDALLRGVAQALMVGFGLAPAVFFLRQARGMAFVGKALSPRQGKVNQLGFLAGQSDCVASIATMGRLMVWFDQQGTHAPLDSQLARVLQTPGLICLPLMGRDQCVALAVVGVESRQQAEEAQARMDLLLAFGRQAGALLETATAVVGPPPAELPTEVGASREQIRHLLHEVGTPLTVVGNYLATLKFTLGEDAPGAHELRIATEEIARVAQILERFQQTPQGPAPAAGPAEVRELLRGLLALGSASGLVPPGVKVEAGYHAGEPAVIAEPDKFKQVLLNLMKNAFEAMPSGGVLRISTARWSGGAGGQVEVTLEDTGPGLPPEVERHLFQPVSTNKGGRHFGIGLSIAAQLVREMNGFIHCHSSPQGCRFRIFLPLVTP